MSAKLMQRRYQCIMDDNNAAMEASEAGSPRKHVTKARKSGITLHYMSRTELRRAVNDFRELKQIVAEENASDQNNFNCSEELEKRVKEQEQKIIELTATLQDTEKRFEDADNLSLNRLMEMIGKDERIKALGSQLDIKEQQIQSMEATKEELERDFKQQLEESRVSYGQLRESSWCDIKLLREEVSELQKASRLKDEEISTLKSMPATTIKMLRKEVIELQEASRLKDTEIVTLKNELAAKASTATLLLASHDKLKIDLKDLLKSSKEEYDHLLAQNTSLREEFNNLTKTMDEKVQSLQEEKQKAIEGTNALKEIIQSLEETIQGLKEKSEEADREHNQQLDSSKQVCDVLTKKNSSLEDECNNITKLMEDKVKSMQEKFQEATKSNTALNEANEYLESSLNSSNKLYEELRVTYKMQLESSKQAHDELQAKHTALESEFKDIDGKRKLMDEEVKSLEAKARQAAENADVLSKTNQSLEESIQALKKKAEESGGELNEQYDKLLSEHEVYVNQSERAMDAKEQQISLKNKEVQRLKEEASEYKAGLEQKQNTLVREYEEQLAKLGEDIASKAKSIEELKAHNESLRSDINEKIEVIEELEGCIKLHNENNERMKVNVSSLTEDLNSQSKVNESLSGQLNESIKCRATMQERIALLEKTLKQHGNGKAFSPEVAGSGHDNTAGKKEGDAAEAEDVTKRLSSDGEEEVAAKTEVVNKDEIFHDDYSTLAGISNIDSTCSEVTIDNESTDATLDATEEKSNDSSTLCGTESSSNERTRSPNADDGVEDNADTIVSQRPKKAHNREDLEKEDTGEIQSGHFGKESKDEDCKVANASNDVRMATKSETRNDPPPQQESHGRRQSKRKATQAYTSPMTEKQRAERLLGPQEKVGKPKPKKPKTQADSATLGKMKLGEVGFRFSKYFGHPHNGWFTGEVVGIRKLNGKNLRRCRYDDGSIEDYTVQEMKRNCKPL